MISTSEELPESHLKTRQYCAFGLIPLKNHTKH